MFKKKGRRDILEKEKIPTYLKHTIKALRVRSGLSQKEASALLGISQPTLRSWEKDSSKLEYNQIKMIEQRYSIPQDYIFFGTDNAFSEKIKQEA